MAILKEFKYHRKHARISLKDMARDIKVSEKTLYNYESGNRVPSYEVVKKYIERLGFEIKIFKEMN